MMKRAISTLLIGGAALLAAGAARADGAAQAGAKPATYNEAWPAPFGLAPTMPQTVHDKPAPWGPPSSIGTALSVGGGLWSFTKSDPYSKTGVGGSWDARLTLGTRKIIGAELAYVGSSTDIKAIGAEDNNYLLRNGAEGVVRLSLPLVRGAGLIAPFGFGGAGWNRYVLRNAGPNVMGILRRDDVMVFPVGGGLTASFHTLMVDIRYTYRFAKYDEMFGGVPMTTQNVGMNVGAEF